MIFPNFSTLRVKMQVLPPLAHENETNTIEKRTKNKGLSGRQAFV